MSSVEVWGKNSCKLPSHPRGDCKDVATGLDTAGDSQAELNFFNPPSEAQRREVSHVSHEANTQWSHHKAVSPLPPPSAAPRIAESGNHRTTELQNPRIT